MNYAPPNYITLEEGLTNRIFLHSLLIPPYLGANINRENGMIHHAFMEL